MKNNTPPYTWAFFGTPSLAVTILAELEAAGLVPSLLVTREDKPAGRKLLMTPPPTKVWAAARGIPVIQPKSLKTESIVSEIQTHAPDGFDFFIVAAYGQIIPQAVLDIPRYGSLNVHPSLLPKLRGPSPIESAILTEEETGVSIMLLDALMDHGPIVAQEKVTVPQDIPEWPPYADVLEHALAHRGAQLLITVLPQYLAAVASAQPYGQEQDHNLATVCHKIRKEDGLIDPSDTRPESVRQNVRKVRAYCVWPRAYFFLTNPQRPDSVGMRVIVTRAREENGAFIIEKVIPEGKKEMAYTDFQKNFLQR